MENLASKTEPGIAAGDLHKKYGKRIALDSITLNINCGEIVGLLGPNGAGKTTTLSILATALRPDRGWARICGHDVRTDAPQARRKLGLVPQSVALYPSLTALENLEFFGRMQGLDKETSEAAAARQLEAVGLTERAEEVVASFSGGMKRRLNLACGMLHRPAALLLDEPTVGVDPQSRERIFEALTSASSDGAAILYSTHYMEEAERLCHRVILIDHGSIVASGSAAELVTRVGTLHRLEIVTRRELPPGWSSKLKGVSELPNVNGTALRAAVTLSGLDQIPAVLNEAQARGGEVIEFHLHRPDLQDAFLALTGHSLRDSE